MFEDIGHSSEARAKLKGFLKGTFEEDPNKPKKTGKGGADALSTGGGGLPMSAVFALLLAIILYYVYTEQNKK
jgi:hypothetical protein